MSKTTEHKQWKQDLEKQLTLLMEQPESPDETRTMTVDTPEQYASYRLKTFACHSVIQKLLDNLKRISFSGQSKAKLPRYLDYIAIDAQKAVRIYGTSALAAERLQEQVNMSERGELEIENPNRLQQVIWRLTQ